MSAKAHRLHPAMSAFADAMRRSASPDAASSHPPKGYPSGVLIDSASKLEEARHPHDGRLAL